jgi:hypothetical protein
VAGETEDLCLKGHQAVLDVFLLTGFDSVHEAHGTLCDADGGDTFCGGAHLADFALKGCPVVAGDGSLDLFKTLWGHLEEEQERRALLARDYIKSSEAQEAMQRIVGEVIARLDKMPAEVGESCNPNDPPKAMEVLAAWVRKTREDLSQ